jgi:hypothetical protein
MATPTLIEHLGVHVKAPLTPRKSPSEKLSQNDNPPAPMLPLVFDFEAPRMGRLRGIIFKTVIPNVPESGKIRLEDPT